MSGHTHFFPQVHHQLQKMSSIVQQIGEIVARETRYVEEMPLATFLEEDTETLLRQADDLIVCQVITHNSIMYMINQTSRQLNKAKQSPEEVFFSKGKLAASGGIRTNDTLLSRPSALPTTCSYRGSSVDMG